MCVLFSSPIPLLFICFGVISIFLLVGWSLWHLVEEEGLLSFLLFWIVLAKDLLHGVWMITSGIYCCCHGERCWCEVLHLVGFQSHAPCFVREILHILHGASWVRGDEVGDYLLTQTSLAIHLVKDTLELVKERKRWLAHDV